MNIPRLKKLLAYLQRVKPERVEMRRGIALSSCGTAGCIAGHAIIRFQPKLAKKMILDAAGNGECGWSQLSDAAEKYLGLSPSGAQMLFHTGNWPVELMQEHRDAMNLGKPKDVRAVVVKRLKLFIDTKGMQ